MRTLTYAQAIREAHAQLLAEDPRVFLIGQGVRNPWYAGTSLRTWTRDFGTHRVIDSPVSEMRPPVLQIGAAITGMRPIVFSSAHGFYVAGGGSHHEPGGQLVIPLCRPGVRAGGDPGGNQPWRRTGRTTFSSPASAFAHVPGLKVVMPATPYDAKGLLIAAVRDGNPVLYIDDRWLYDLQGMCLKVCMRCR